jgi:hypothetical protein
MVTVSNYSRANTTRMVKTSFRDCTELLNLLLSLKAVAKKWYALWAHKVLL